MPAADSLTIHEILHLLELAGVAVFAVSGALMAAEKRMDPFGFVVLGTVTAIGGGTLRDLVLGGGPVFWVDQPDFLMVCIVVSLPVFWLARLLRSVQTSLLWFDALGMAMFTVTGTHKALAMGAPGVVAGTMGVMSAAFGGILRDVICGERPLLLHSDVYATAALAGAILLVQADALGLSPMTANWGAFALIFVIRAGAIRFGWSIPSYKP